MQKLRILYQDASLVAVDKPAGYQVHTPEAASRAGEILYRNNVMRILRNQLNQWVYPVHRLDRATTGVLFFALAPEVAQKLQAAFQEERVAKTYFTVARGWLVDSVCVDHPLEEKEARTDFEVISRFELPHSIGKYERVRYSLLKAKPSTGRYHQIRRHLKHLSHPIVGDSVYGDGKHNRLWRELLGGSAMLLKAYSVDLPHPESGEPMFIHSRWGKVWHKVFDLAGVCPFENKNAREQLTLGRD